MIERTDYNNEKDILSFFGCAKPVVLAVDDSEDNLRLIEEILGLNHISVRKATSGQEALDILKKEEVDLLLLDVMMPGLDGFQLASEIRKDNRYGYIPILLVTALNSMEDRERGEMSGADDFLSKPFTPRELLVRVRSLLKIRALNLELTRTKDALKEANIKLKIDNIRLEKEVSLLQEKIKYTLEPENGLKSIKIDTEHRIELHPETINIFLEKKPLRGMEMFITKLSEGHTGMCVTRTKPSFIREKYGLVKTNIIWLTTNKASDEICIDPSNIGRLSQYICQFITEVNNGVILLDGIEYIVSKNDFKTTFNLLTLIHDKLMLSSATMILSLDPIIFSYSEVSMIEKEGIVVYEDEVVISEMKRLFGKV